MNRRSLLKFLALGVIGHELDVDRLLWLPGQKTIFLPSTKILVETKIVSTYFDFIVPHMKKLFEQKGGKNEMVDGILRVTDGHYTR